MSTRYKITHKENGKDVECGCSFIRDRAGRDMMETLCEQHRAEFNQRHEAAVLSCSQVNRDLVG
jgi:hypothetical protein